jgi:hypothetical protein
MRIKIMLFVIAVMISLQAATAYGMGIGVSPGNMSFKLAPGASAEQLIYVINKGNEIGKYDVFVNEGNYQKGFTFSPSSFNLKAGEQKEVKVTLKVPASAEPDVKCKIKIPCTVPGKTVGAGIIVPVHIEISALYAWESFTEYASNSGLNEIKQFFANCSQIRFNFMQNITGLGEKIKSFAENSEAAATGIFYNTTKNTNNTIKSPGEKNPSALTKIEGYEEKFRALPGFDAPLEFICLVISGLLMKRKIFRNG